MGGPSIIGSIKEYRIEWLSVANRRQLSARTHSLVREAKLSTARSTSGTVERRRNPRTNLPFHVKVHGIDDAGKKFSIETVVDNISGSGLYLRMLPYVEEGAKLVMDIQLKTAHQLSDEGRHFSVDGTVVRSEKLAGGASGVAVSFAKVRFP